MRTLPIVALILVALVSSCGKTPGYVISEKKMANLMVDLYIGDAVVEKETKTYSSDSLRRVLQQSIYAEHGVTREEYDTSLVWYGNNLQAYMDVCNMAEELLQKRIEETERAGGRTDKSQQSVSIDGDSVDVWTGVRFRRNIQNMPAEYISFSLQSDKNWDRGDRYTLSVRGQNTRRVMTLNMAVDYNDGTTEYNSVTAPAEGMSRLLLVLDSTKIASNVYGTISYTPMEGEVSYLDSISFVRTRGRNDNVRAREGQKTVLLR